MSSLGTRDAGHPSGAGPDGIQHEPVVPAVVGRCLYREHVAHASSFSLAIEVFERSRTIRRPERLGHGWIDPIVMAVDMSVAVDDQQTQVPPTITKDSWPPLRPGSRHQRVP